MRKLRPIQATKRRNASDFLSDKWIENEVVGCQFQDARHGKRLRQLLEQLSGKVGSTTPWASQDWANTKAAYRFFGNDRISEANILAGHFASTRERFAARSSSPILVLHDTTEFSFKREDGRAVGILQKLATRYASQGRPQYHTSCGILMHSSLAVTRGGLPLGLASIKFWNRDKFHGANALKRSINPTRVPIEKKESIRWLENLRQSTELLNDPGRCVHIGDRESDIYELFCLARQLGTHFLVRTCVNRLAGDGGHTVRDEMKQAPVRGLHRVQVRNKRGEFSTAVLEIRSRRMVVRPPIGKQQEYSALILTVTHAQERDTPKGRDKIDWKLLTDLPVRSCKQAAEKLDWYAQRWKIETFHKILKSGCRAEEAKLRTAERLANLIAILCIVSWRIFWITMLNRTDPEASPNNAFTQLDQYLLDELLPHKAAASPKPSLAHYIVKLARLGGYLARAHDPPPGNTVIWRGLSRLTDIELGIMIGVQLVGN
jgi:Transposase DNA-binding/Transposase Tn5 dimerisation domain